MGSAAAIIRRPANIKRAKSCGINAERQNPVNKKQPEIIRSRAAGIARNGMAVFDQEENERLRAFFRAAKIFIFFLTLGFS